MSSNKDEMYVRWDNSWINLSNGERIKGLERPKLRKLEEFFNKKISSVGNPYVKIDSPELASKLGRREDLGKYYNISFKKAPNIFTENGHGDGMKSFFSDLQDKPNNFLFVSNEGNYDKDPDVARAFGNTSLGAIEPSSYYSTQLYSSGSYQELDYIFAGDAKLSNLYNAIFFYPGANHIREENRHHHFIHYTSLYNCIIVIKDKSLLTQTDLTNLELHDGSLILDTKSEEYKTFEDELIKWMEESNGTKPFKEFIDRYTKKSSGKVTPVTNYELEEFLHSKAGSESFVETSDTGRISDIMFNESSTTDRFCLINYKKVQDISGLNDSIIPNIINKPIAFVLFNKGLTDHSKDVKYLFASNLTFYNGASNVPSLEVNAYSFGTYQELDYIYQTGSGWGIYKNTIIFCPNAKEIVEISNFQDLEFKHCIIVVNDKSKINMTGFKLSEGSIIIDTKSPAYNKLVTEFKTWMTDDSVEEDPNEVRDFINSVLPKLN